MLRFLLEKRRYVKSVFFQPFINSEVVHKTCSIGNYITHLVDIKLQRPPENSPPHNSLSKGALNSYSAIAVIVVVCMSSIELGLG
jgi:hypothetical protein